MYLLSTFKSHFQESLKYISPNFQGLLFLEICEEEDSLYIKLWEDLSTNTFSIKIKNKIDIKPYLSIVRIHFPCTDDYEWFYNFYNTIGDSDSGLITNALSKILNKDISEILEVAPYIPRYYAKNMSEILELDCFFYNLTDEKIFYGSKKTKKRYLKRWLKTGKYIKLVINGELVFLLTVKSNDYAIVKDSVIQLFKEYSPKSSK